IRRLRERMAEISKQLDALDRPALRGKRDIYIWYDSLDKLSQRLAEINKMPLEELQEIIKACDEIERELEGIKKGIDNLQG
ncbi:MAG: hypothetical protein ACREAM_20140, partial [Blastocatellia bacterium]